MTPEQLPEAVRHAALELACAELEVVYAIHVAGLARCLATDAAADEAERLAVKARDEWQRVLDAQLELLEVTDSG